MEQVEKTKQDLCKIPDASGWSEEMDALLLERRGAKRLPWRAVAPIGPMNAKRCQGRFKLLTSGARRPAVKVAKAEPPPADKDGLEWLQRKGRLSAERLAAAQHYRRLFRDAGPVSVKSCLNVAIGGGLGGPELRWVASADAREQLHAIRAVVLRAQPDLLTVVDGVCGVGHTIRALVGDSVRRQELEARAKVLEGILMVALDLIIAHLAGNQQAAA